MGHKLNKYKNKSEKSQNKYENKKQQIKKGVVGLFYVLGWIALAIP